MWDKIKGFIFDNQGKSSKADGSHDHSELQIAAAALLVEAAMLDGEFEENERCQIVGDCIRHFEMESDVANALVDEATKRAKAAVDVYGFIKTLLAHFDDKERISLLEMLWAVVYADGSLHTYEANLIRRVGGMLGISDQENGEVRKRVLSQIEAAPG
jgi:uncharacterized tellurite resistance protein B-like protein